MNRNLAAVLATTTCILAIAAPARAQAATFEIPAGSLSSTLDRFARQSGQQVVYRADDVRSARSSGVNGTMTSAAALRVLLTGTGFAAHSDSSGAVAIVRSARVAAAPEPQSPVGAASPQTSVAVDEPAAAPTEIIVTGSRIARRDYQSSSPIVTVDQTALASAGQPTLDRALGNMPQFAAAQGLAQVGDVQARTGFSGGQSYSDLRGLGSNRSLVLLDGRRLIASNPNGSIDLNTIPSSMIGNVEVITGGASAAYGSDAIAGVVNFKLRTKFNGIELSARHGGTTQGDAATNQVTALLGADFADGRGNAMLAFEYADRAAVAGSERPFFQNIRLLARPPEGIIEAGQFGSQPTIAAVNAVLAQYPGTTPIAGTGSYTGAIGVNTDGTLFTTSAGTNCVQNYRGLSQGLLGLGITSNCRQVAVANGNYFAVQVPLTKYNALAKVDYAITDDITVYGMFNFMYSSGREGSSPGSSGPGKYFFVPLSSPFVTGNAGLQTLLASRPTPSTAPLALTKLLTFAGPRMQTFEYNVYQGIIGARGKIPGTELNFDIYGSLGRTNFTNVQYNDVSKAAFQSIVDGTANYTGPAGTCRGYAFNPFGTAAMSAACREYAVRNNNNFSSTGQEIVEASINGPLFSLPGGEVRFAVGADYRSNSFDYRPDSALIRGDTPSFDNSNATGGRQTVKEVFGELSIPIFRDWALGESLTVDLGYRYSDYSGFGGVSAYKGDVSYRPISQLLIRGGYQRAIRAPSLGELYAPTLTGANAIGAPPGAGDPCDSRSSFRTGPTASQVQALCLAQGVPAAIYPTFTYVNDTAFGSTGGNPNLTPEKADSYTFGAVLSPRSSSPWFRGFNLSIDYYNISIRDAIGTLTLTTILPRCFNSDGVSNPNFSATNLFCQQITRDTNSGAISFGREGALNLATYKTDGIDGQLDWAIPLEAFGSNSSSTVRFNTVVTYLMGFQVSSLPGSPVLDYAGSIGNSAVSPQISHPRWKANTSIGFSSSWFTVSGTWRFIDQMVHQDLIANAASTTPGVPAYSYFDANAVFRVKERFEFSLGLTNITDVAPPFVSGQPLTTDSATYDIIGRTFFVGAKVRF